MDPKAQFDLIIEPLMAYHSYQVEGLSHIPETGPCILVVTHSFVTYDIGMLLKNIIDTTNRIPRPLADRWFFKVPQISSYIKSFGAFEGNHKTAESLLRKGELICIAPGGMREAIRPSSQRYQVVWGQRKGFVRLAVKTGAPIILAACPKADDIYEIYNSRLTMWFYKNFKLPVPILRGIGITPFPRPVDLTHFISKPIMPPKASDNEATFQKQVDKFHKKVIAEMQSLIGQAIAYNREEDE